MMRRNSLLNSATLVRHEPTVDLISEDISSEKTIVPFQDFQYKYQIFNPLTPDKFFTLIFRESRTDDHRKILGKTAMIWDIEKQSFSQPLKHDAFRYFTHPINQTHFLSGKESYSTCTTMSLWNINNLDKPIKSFPFVELDFFGDQQISFFPDNRHFVSFGLRTYCKDSINNPPFVTGWYNLQLWDLEHAEQGPKTVFDFNFNNRANSIHNGYNTGQHDNYDTGLIALPDGEHFIGGGIRHQITDETNAAVTPVLTSLTNETPYPIKYDKLAIWNIHQPNKPVGYFDLPACLMSKFTLLKDQHHFIGECTWGDIYLWDYNQGPHVIATFKNPNKDPYFPGKDYVSPQHINQVYELSNGKLIVEYGIAMWEWDLTQPEKGATELEWSSWDSEYTYIDSRENIFSIDENGKHTLVYKGVDDLRLASTTKVSTTPALESTQETSAITASKKMILSATIKNNDAGIFKPTEIKASKPTFKPALYSHDTDQASQILLNENPSSKTYIFPKKINSPTIASFSENEFYQKSTCTPIEFHRRSAIVCENEHSTIVNIPLLASLPLEKVGDNIMLAAVFLNLSNRLFNWCKSFFLPSEPKALIDKNVFEKYVNSFKEKLERIEKQIDNLDKKNLKWTLFALEEHHENLNQLIRDYAAKKVDLSVLIEFDQDIDNFENEVLEEFNRANEAKDLPESTRSLQFAAKNTLNGPFIFSIAGVKENSSKVDFACGKEFKKC